MIANGLMPWSVCIFSAFPIAISIAFPASRLPFSVAIVIVPRLRGGITATAATATTVNVRWRLVSRSGYSGTEKLPLRFQNRETYWMLSLTLRRAAVLCNRVLCHGPVCRLYYVICPVLCRVPCNCRCSSGHDHDPCPYHVLCLYFCPYI